MDGDFGAELDAALKARLSELWAAADEARERVDRGVDALGAPRPEPLPIGEVPFPEESEF